MLRTTSLSQQDERTCPKILYIFSLEGTLTKGPMNILHSKEDIQENLQEDIPEIFRAIWKAGDIIGISSENLLPHSQLIHEYLIASELTEEEFHKIPIKCRGDFLTKLKSELTIELIESTPHIAAVNYYDSSPKELNRVIEAFNNKKLTNGRFAMIKLNGIHVKEGETQFLNDLKQKYGIHIPTTQLPHSVLYKQPQTDDKKSESRSKYCCRIL
jgi:hypothetical protein